MASSKEVFALRKDHRLQEAYEMGCEVVRENPHDEWNKKALAWCLIDMIKKSITEKNIPLSLKYMTDLNDMNLDLSDDVLKKNIDYLKQITNPKFKIINDARNLSKQGDHDKSANAFREAIRQFPDDIQLYESLAWEIYNSSKGVFSTENIDINNAKKILFEYIKLKNNRPSRIHSLFLRNANKLIEMEGFSLVGFLKLWNLENLTEEDFQPYIPEKGKTLPSLAETIIQHAAKEIIEKKMIGDVNFILPYLDNAIDRCGQKVWLIYYKAKLLQLVNKQDEALAYIISVVKNKMNDFWSWNLLSENFMHNDPDLSFACLCRALLCKSEDKYLGNIRLKVAKTMLEKGLYSEAKHEIIRIIKARENEGWPISEELKSFQQESWYQNTQESKNNSDLYQQYAVLAEEVLFSDVPWVIGIVDYINYAKKIAHFIVDKTIDGIMKKVDCPHKIEVGTKVKMKLSKHEDYYKILKCIVTDENPQSDILKNFFGTIKVTENFHGFVTCEDSKDKIFLDRNIVESYNLNTGNTISGTAIINFDKARNRWGWKALKIH